MAVEVRETETKGPPQEGAVLDCCLWVLSMRYVAFPLLYFLVLTEFWIWSHSNSRSIILLVTQGSMSSQGGLSSSSWSHSATGHT